MRRCAALAHTLLLLVLVGSTEPIGSPLAKAVTITVDFSAESILFSNSTARSAVEAAAADLSAAIASSLNGIATDVWQGNYQSTSATFDFGFFYPDPTLGPGQTVEIPSATIGSNSVQIALRSRSITTHNVLGEGGPAGLGASIQLSGVASQAPTAVANAAGKATTAYLRGGASPTIGTLTSDPLRDVWNNIPFPYAIDYGVSHGVVWFDVDANNDGVVDSSQSLTNFWHYDHTTSPPPGKNDLYSVALHEMLHVLGIGGSKTWNALAQGNNWLGPEASALAGGGANLIVGNHIAHSVMSPRLADGVMQEVLMDPNLNQGTRKRLTLLDLAFLRDLGWQTVLPSFDGDFNQDGRVDQSDFALWSAASAQGSQGDADQDGDSDGHDFLIWQRHRGLGGASAQSTGLSIPEPRGSLAALAASIWIALRRRSNLASRQRGRRVV